MVEEKAYKKMRKELQDKIDGKRKEIIGITAEQQKIINAHPEIIKKTITKRKIEGDMKELNGQVQMLDMLAQLEGFDLSEKEKKARKRKKKKEKDEG